MTDQEIESLARKKAEADLEARAIVEAVRKSEKRRKALKTAGYVVGSAAIFAVACATIPSLLSNASGTLYKSSLKKARLDDDDDWGPVIERKETSADQEKPEQSAETEEEQSDGD